MCHTVAGFFGAGLKVVFAFGVTVTVGFVDSVAPDEAAWEGVITTVQIGSLRSLQTAMNKYLDFHRWQRFVNLCCIF